MTSEKQVRPADIRPDTGPSVRAGRWQPDPKVSAALDRHLQRMGHTSADGHDTCSLHWFDAYGLGFNKGWEQGYAAGRANE